MGLVKFKYDAIDALTRTANEIVNNVVKKYSHELDELMTQVEHTLRAMKEKKTQISHSDLQRLVLKIPALMYRMIDPVDMAGLESDVAQMAHKMVHADYYAKEKGTIVDKNRVADMASGDEATIVDLTKRVHNRLRRRVEVAGIMFDAVRKLITTQDKEREIFKNDPS